MNAGAGPLGEADIHGLVDGRLEAARRAEVLRKLAASPADRATVEAWQEQNDMIRAAFRDVEREALPVALNLAPPRLRCIDGDLEQRLAPMRIPPVARRKTTIVTAATVLIVAVGLIGSWLAITRSDEDRRAAPPSPEATLAERVTNALAVARPRTVDDMAQVQVPDLSAAGLRLTGVSTKPGSLVLRYRDAGDGRVALGLAGAPDTSVTPPSPVGVALAWRRGGTAYALAGTLPAERLRKLARSLQDETGQD